MSRKVKAMAAAGQRVLRADHLVVGRGRPQMPACARAVGGEERPLGQVARAVGVDVAVELQRRRGGHEPVVHRDDR
jgi:hypothetical protein